MALKPWHGVDAPSGLWHPYLYLYLRKSRSSKCLLHFHYLPSKWQLITILLFMREMDSAFLFQTEAIDIPRIVPGEGKPIAKCSFRNNLQSVAQAWVQRCGPCWFSLTDKENKALHRRPGLGAGSSQERADILMGENMAAPWDCSLPAQAEVGRRHLGRWVKRGPQGVSVLFCFPPCPPPPSLSL